MRILVAALLLALPLTASAQQNPAESNWIRVQALPQSQAITIKVSGHRTHCRFLSADANSITCTPGSKSPVAYPRSQINLVQTSHRSKSTLIGLGVGTAGGAIFGAAIGRSNSFIPRGAAAAGFGALGAVIGTLIGVGGNFAHTTIYRAP